MHFLSYIFSGIFVALVIAFALTFGMALFVVLGLLGLAAVALFYIQIWWRRWQITRAGGVMPSDSHTADVPPSRPGEPPVIDVEYKDVTGKEKP